MNKELKEYIDQRESFLKDELSYYLSIKGYFVIIPMITFSDSVGLVIIYNDKQSVLKYKDIAIVLSKLIVLD